MRQSDIKEQVVEPIISGMNLADMKIYTDNSGEVQEVLLKHVPGTGTAAGRRPWEQAAVWG